MKSICLKVMTLLMVALVLSASVCSNENEMSSPEGTVKGFLKTINKVKYINVKKMQSYWDPAMVPDKNTVGLWYENCFHKLLGDRINERYYGGLLGGERDEKFLSFLTQDESPGSFAKLSISNVKTTLVSDKLGKVWKGDKWHPQKQATVEVSYKRTIPTDKAIMFDNCQDTVKLVKLDNKWYIERWSGF